MRITVVILVLLGINAFANGYLHSNVKYVLQPGEFRNFYLPEQTGSISLNILEGGEHIGEGQVIIGASPKVTVEGDTYFNGDRSTRGVYAARFSDTSDWYPFLWNQNDTTPITITFELEVHESITASGRSVPLSLSPYAFQYVRIPAEVNHGLSFRFYVQCADDIDGNGIDIYAKSASYYALERESDFVYYSLWENEEVLVLIENEYNQERNCTLSIVSQPTVVLTNGLNTIDVNNTDTHTIGTRYTPTANVVRIQVNPTNVDVSHDANRAYRPYPDLYVTDGRTVQNFVFDTSNLMTVGDQLNVTVTPIPIVTLSNGVKQSFQCINSGDYHIFALAGNDNSGAVLRVTQFDGAFQLSSYYVKEEESPLSAVNSFDVIPGAPQTQFADSNGVVWVLLFVCQSDNTNGSITAHLPMISPLSIGKNVITIDTEDSYYVLPEGVDQTTLGVHMNSSNSNGWYAPHSFRGYDWNINSGMVTDVVYARESPVVSPAWYFVLSSLGDVAETVELTLTTYPIVALESGKLHQFFRPDDDSYGTYTTVAKLESGNNGLGHALPLSVEYEVGDRVRVTVNSFVETASKRSVTENTIVTSEFGNATYYFAVRVSYASSPLNLTATFAPVTTAVNGVVDFSRNVQGDEDISYHSFLFPAMKRHNSLFKFEYSPFTDRKFDGFEGIGGYLDDIPGYFLSIYQPDSLAAYFVTETAKGQNTTVHLESVATIGLCSSQYDCNGHGSCATLANQCTCTDGYSGDWCDVPPTPTDDNNNSGAGQMMVATCQLLVFVAIYLFV